jgi:hypothetical protein
VHTVPHTPQFAPSVFVFASQPFVTFPSQLAKPGVQTGTQTLAAQLVVPFGLAHTVPQAPQAVPEVAVLVSQPFARFPSQFAKPGVQTGAQTPAAQLVVPFAFAHALPHALQLEVSVRAFTSQPLVGFESQFAKPELQAPSVHTPETQVSAAFARLQAVPQPPQSVSVEMFLSQPLTAFESQLANPAAHEGVHAPPTHAVEPFVFVQAMAHDPQCAFVIARSVSQPFAAWRSQSALPALHEQAPAVQAPPGHAVAAGA